MGDPNALEGYDEKYRTPDYFHDRMWLYRPFVKALIDKACLKPGSRVLDAGCGQGFFTALFAKNRLDTTGVDLSSVGIASARKIYARSGARFEVGDILDLNWGCEFDCVFTRSCSLYNSALFQTQQDVTDTLLGYIREGGTLIFDYYTRPNSYRLGGKWIYHSVAAARRHFSKYNKAPVYFSLRLETVLFRKFSFSPPVSRLCELFSRFTGLGGELVAFVQKS